MQLIRVIVATMTLLALSWPGTSSAAEFCQDFKPFSTVSGASSPVTAPLGYTILPEFSFYINSIYPPFSSPTYDFATVGSGTFLYGYGGQYEVEWAGPNEYVVSLEFELVHFNDPDVEITAFGVYLDFMTMQWEVGYLRDPLFTAINGLVYGPDSGSPSIGQPYDVTVNLASLQYLWWVQLTPVDNEIGIHEMCVTDHS